MRGTQVLVSSEPRGKFVEGVIASGITPKPGTIMQIDASVALVGGRHTWGLYSRDADGNRPKGPYIVLLEDKNRGRTYADAYAAGDRAFGYIPEAGDELNLLLSDVSGTGDAHTKGEILMVDSGTGEMIATTGSPESEPALLLETLSALTEDTHGWCIWTGY